VQSQQLLGNHTVSIWYGVSTHKAWQIQNVYGAGTIGNKELCFGSCKSERSQQQACCLLLLVSCLTYTLTMKMEVIMFSKMSGSF
jgi:hypothetical protein